ncbi:hypothetical protein P7D22_19515 [Lichenihabitans sp. Uapishka_5]|uniref:hypothetical protein n=1 Tax=Lichenihabitans sp. Uapishka_5 TaxID=3037302 RepID=UPI0029E7CCF7|nr:hypothetical protein [Lichenihabitans sp. Uapishka_5]MDX7953356.1 hypothetical protein [Lichenihabitans sp. Uapishka_5]
MIPAGALATLAVLKLSPDQSAGVAHVMVEIEEATAIDVARRMREGSRAYRRWCRGFGGLTHRRRLGVMCDQAG